MSEPKKPLSAATLAAFLAGAGFGVGTEIIIRPATTEEPGWRCSVMQNNDVFCSTLGEAVNLSDDLTVRIDSPDAGVPDAGVPDGHP